MGNQEFSALLTEGWPGLSKESRERVEQFREWVVDENSRQNLTKLISPEDFFEGHVLDVKALSDSEMVSFPAMDLGSGVGVPGLLSAVIEARPWVLAESEGHKAAFLSRLVESLGLKSNVQVFSGRAETFLSAQAKENRVETIVARAVGPVSRIYSWIRPCSTWNNLVLLKGPRWEEEWKEFEDGRYRGELKWTKTFAYTVGRENKQRIIVRLERVPRGTTTRKR